MQPTSDRDSSKLFLEVLHLNAASQEIVKHLKDRGLDSAATKKALRLACSAGRAAVDSTVSRVAASGYLYIDPHPDAATLLTSNWDVRHFTLLSNFWPRDALGPFLQRQKRLETLVLKGHMHAEFVDALMNTELSALTKLELDAISWESAAIKSFSSLPFLPQLRQLDIAGPLPDEIPGVWIQIPDFLPMCTSLEALAYWNDNVGIGPDVFSDIIRISLPRLREFYFAADFREYSENLRQNLNSVSVANTWTSLKKLSLYNDCVYQNIEGTNATKPILAYMDCFAAVDGITNFSISDGNLCTNDLPTILNVPWCSNLTSLHIEGSGFLMDDAAASCFAKADWKNLQRLEFFDYDYWRLPDKAFVRGIGFANVTMPSLRYFCLENVFIDPAAELFSIPVCNQLTYLKLNLPFCGSDGDVSQEEKAVFLNLLQNRDLSNLEELLINGGVLFETVLAMAYAGYGKMPALQRLDIKIREIADGVECEMNSNNNDYEVSMLLGLLNGSLPRQAADDLYALYDE